MLPITDSMRRSNGTASTLTAVLENVRRHPEEARWRGRFAAQRAAERYSWDAVSQRYAEEICSLPMGCGLEGVLTQRGHDLSGIINGVDYSIWNPKTDPHLAANYDASNWQLGKAACKADLLRTFGLSAEPDLPLVGVVSRRAARKS